MSERLRYALAGPASVLLVMIMLVGCLLLWIGVPVAWLWVGSQIQAAASLGTALMVTMAGAIITIIAIVLVLSWVNHKHAEMRARRHHRDEAQGALEPMLVISAGLAAILFAIWFFGFSGASPLPLHMGY